MEKKISLKGETAGDTLEAIRDYTIILSNAEEHIEAGKWIEHGVIAARQRFGENHSLTIALEIEYAGWLGDVGRLEEAAREFKALLTRLRNRVNARQADIVEVIYNYTHVLNRQGNFNVALPLITELTEKADAALGEGHIVAMLVPLRYGVNLLGLKRYPEAEEAMLSSWNRLQANIGIGAKSKMLVVNKLIELYQATHQDKKVADWQKKLRALQAELDAKNQTATPPFVAKSGVTQKER